MRKSILFIVNPFSGTSNKNDLDSIVKNNLDHSTYEYQIKYTKYTGHATVLASEAAEKLTDIVVAVGGDGSVNEVAKGLLNSQSVLGILPGGSGNGFAMHLGMGRDITKAVRKLNKSIVQHIDTCTVNDIFFINVAGIGFDARIAFKTKLNKKRGFLPYFFTSLKEVKNYRPLTMKINIDGKIIEGKYALAEVANATMFGYNFTIAPTALLNDGLLDVVLIKHSSLIKYMTSSFRLITKSLDKSSISEVYRGKEISISVEEDDYLHVDGEGMLAEKNFSFSIAPNSIKVLIPS